MHDKISLGPILCRSCAGNHSCSESRVMWCPCHVWKMLFCSSPSPWLLHSLSPSTVTPPSLGEDDVATPLRLSTPQSFALHTLTSCESFNIKEHLLQKKLLWWRLEPALICGHKHGVYLVKQEERSLLWGLWPPYSQALDQVSMKRVLQCGGGFKSKQKSLVISITLMPLLHKWGCLARKKAEAVTAKADQLIQGCGRLRCCKFRAKNFLLPPSVGQLILLQSLG